MDKNLYDKSIRILQNYYPDQGTSCIRKENTDDKQPGDWMLDIIVPAYNVELYIDACIRSVLKQKTEFPFRIIIVNDGSGDRTGEYIDHYGDEKNVLVIHQKNKGLAGARNTGLLYAQARYVMFVDSDDCLPSDAVQKLVIKAEQTDADIVAGSYCNFRKYRWFHKKYIQKGGILSSELELKGHAWGKVYRRELFKKVQFPENYWFEDSVMHQIIFPEASRLLGISDVIYERRVNRKSITQTSAGNPKSLDSLWVTLKLMNDREKMGMGVTQSYYEYMLNQIRLTHTRVSRLGKEIQKAVFTVMAYELEKNFSGYSSENLSGGKLEQAIRALDFEQFDIFVRN